MYITILLPPGLGATPGAVGVLLAYLARRGGAAPRGGAEVDVFPAKRGTLLLVRPSGALTAAVADYALPYIHKYFTD